MKSSDTKSECKIPFLFYRDNIKKPDCSCLLLKYDNWDDFGIKSQFDLYFYTPGQIERFIGNVKILCVRGMDITDKLSKVTDDQVHTLTFSCIKEGYLQQRLDNQFVSLGQNLTYYRNLVDCFGVDTALEILNCLNDCALIPRNLEKISHLSAYKYGLIRFDEANRAVRQARLFFNGSSIENSYHFKINFQPSYATDKTSVEFKFQPEKVFPQRVYCLIGKNGVGKSQLLGQIPDLISEEKSISPFAKYLFVSTCYSEFFSKEKKVDMTTMYESCGLTEFINEQKRIRTPEEVKDAILKNFFEIVEKINSSSDPVSANRHNDLTQILNKLFPRDKVVDLIYPDEKTYRKVVNEEKVKKLCEYLSSGEFILLYVITSIVAKIRLGSLLLFDEPETHLHPNAVSQLMSTIFEILQQFDSFAIIATHSPLVIREVQSSSVRVIDRYGSSCYVRNINQECLGGDLSELTREVFGTEDDQLYYKKLINTLKHRNYSSAQIIKELTSENVPLGVGLRFYINNGSWEAYEENKSI